LFVTKRPISEPVLRSSGGCWRPVTWQQAKRFQLGNLRPSLDRYAGEALDGSLWLEAPLDAHWRACYRVQLQGVRRRRFVIAEVRLLPIEEGALPGEWSGATIGPRAAVPDGGISADLFKRLQNRRTLALVAARIHALQERYQQDAARVLLQDELPAPRQRGRPPAKPLSFYRAFARKYVDAEFYRRDRSTRRTLAQIYRTDEQTVARWIRKCRGLGLLSKTAAGRRGGELIESPLQRIATEVETGRHRRR
jgi:hypothetical protein